MSLTTNDPTAARNFDLELADRKQRAEAKPEPTPTEIRQAHFDAISGHLERNENEFRELVKNEHAPADAISNSLTAIHALRVERDHNRP